jgi:hypothetical protein
MSNSTDPKRKEVIAEYINENLKEVFAGYVDDSLPTEVTDLLSVLKAQDQEMDKE